MDWKEGLYNVGSITSYVQQGIFAVHGVHIIATDQKPSWSMMSILVVTLVGIVLAAPYKWDKRSMRIKSIVGMIVYSLVLVMYLFALFR